MLYQEHVQLVLDKVFLTPPLSLFRFLLPPSPRDAETLA
jgi:hypothetical protein